MNSARLLMTSAVPSRAPSSSWRRSSVAILSRKFWVSNMARASRGLRYPPGRLRRLLRVPLVEPVDPAGGVHQLLLAGEERMAVRVDVDAEVAAGGERVVDRAAGARDVRGAIVGMSCCVFHWI